VRATATVVLIGLLAAALAGSAAGDGDPASDTLLSSNVFLPYPAPSKRNAAELERVVARVYANGYRVKVAVIATRTDLGAIPSLFGRPETYAKFLGQELAFYYVGPLLIVMPDAYGIYDGGRTTAAEERVLWRLAPAGKGANALATAATAAVRKLLDARALRSRDIRAPYAHPVPVRGRRGKRVDLEYDLADDSGRSTVVVRVKAGGRLLARFRQSRRGIGLKTYSVTWQVPRALPAAKLSFCVTATDPAGNRSKTYCARISVA
jgi:hypothetical protein